MPDTLYLGILPENDPMLIDPSIDFGSARLTDDKQRVVIANQKPHQVAAYPCKNVMDVNKGEYDTIVIMCADDNRLADRLVRTLKDRPLIAYFSYHERSGFAHDYCGVFHLFQMLRLRGYPGANWQIILSQCSVARLKARYDNPNPYGDPPVKENAGDI